MRLLIGADVVPTDATEKLFVNADMEPLFGSVAALSKSFDRVIINLECALTEYDGAIKKFGPNLKASPKCTNALKALGVTDVMLSNNHVLDFGIKGLRDTMAALDEAGIPYTGVGENDVKSRKPYFIEDDGKRIAIINVCEHEYSYATETRLGANPYDPYLTMEDIRVARSVSDFVIVIYHGGKEHCRYPSPRLRNLAHEMVRVGADAVLMQHSHCIGCYERFEGGHIVYGQGNFNFSYGAVEKQPTWYTSLLVELDVGKEMNIAFHPMITTETGCDLARGARAAEILTAFNERNASLLDGSWRDGWHAFCTSEEIKNNYTEKVEREFDDDEKRQLFAHFLDCEAHTDVWRELYPTWNATNE